MTSIARKVAMALALLGTVLIAACGGGGGAGGSVPTGTLGVSLTDSPACGFSAVNVTVSEVRVHQSSTASATAAGWSTITLNPARKINLLDLGNGVLTSLGQTALPAGHYTQLRLLLVANTGSNTANSVVLTGTTTEIPLSTPSGVQSGIKLIHQFDVAAGQTTDLALDFDACKSIVETGGGKYLLNPVIDVIPFVFNGIEGYVDPTLLDASNSKDVMVYAEQNGEVVRSSTPDPSTGKFVLARLDPANPYDVVITANGYATSVITGVPVASTTSVTDVSTNTNPITLSSSAIGTISGTVTLIPSSSTTVAYVAAKQKLNNGNTTITVQSQAANPMDGSYTLTLPRASADIGTYPVTAFPLLADTTVTPAFYTLQASADGYTTATLIPSGDLTTSDLTNQNITLQ